MSPKYPEVVVEIKSTANATTVRDTVFYAVWDSHSRPEAKAWVKESRPLKDVPSLLDLAAQWVTVKVIEADTSAGRGPLDDLAEPIEGVQRWQYAVVDIGSFGAQGRMAEVLRVAGSTGWELVSVYDKASNWIGNMEKGFMLLKRAVPEGVTPSEWAITIRN